MAARYEIPEVWDLAVVGAGPAGSIVAYVAAGRGLRVALIDQRDFPRDKSCGDGIGPGVARLLNKIGLSDVLAGETAIEEVEIIGPDGTTVRSQVPVLDGQLQSGYVVPRERFDHQLFSAALNAGAADFSRHKLVGIFTGESGDGRVAATHRGLMLRGGGGETVLRCRLLVGADGPYSVVRRVLSVPAHPARHTGIAMRAYAELADRFDVRLIFDFHREVLPGYGWIFPDGKGMINIGIGLPLTEVRRRDLNIRAMLESFAASSRRRGVPLGRLHRHRSHHLPLAATIPRLTYDRAVLVGDSAAMINPMSGEGIVYAMTSAVELAQRLPMDMSDSGRLGISLTDYATWYRSMYHRHMRLNFMMSKIFSRPSIADRVIRRLHENPETMRLAVKLLFDASEAHRRKWWQTRMLWRGLRTLFLH